MQVPEGALILYTSYLDGGEKEAADCEMQVEEYLDECHSLISLMMLTWPKEVGDMKINLWMSPPRALTSLMILTWHREMGPSENPKSLNTRSQGKILNIARRTALKIMRKPTSLHKP
jgi:hypothetical protein